MSKFRDLTGLKFNHLTVLKRVPPPSHVKNNFTYFECRCDCGNITIVYSCYITSGKTKTCGKLNCPYNFKLRQGNLKHGQASSTNKRTKEYSCYLGIIRRCYDTNNHSYSKYGGRGIKVCDRWLEDDGFQNFFNDMGKAPSNDHSIDRIDNNGNYEPSNCRWSLPTVQARNRRDNTFNENLVKTIRWDYEVNKLSLSQIIRLRNLNFTSKSYVCDILKYRAWKDVSIEKEKIQYLNIK